MKLPKQNKNLLRSKNGRATIERNKLDCRKRPPPTPLYPFISLRKLGIDTEFLLCEISLFALPYSKSFGLVFFSGLVNNSDSIMISIFTPLCVQRQL